MTHATLTARNRRALVVGAGVISVLVLTSRGIPTWRAWHDEARASAAELVSEAARARRAITQLPIIRDSLAARRERLAAIDSLLLEGRTPGAAAAALTDAIGEAATEAGVRLGAVQVRVDSTARSAATALPATYRVAVQADVTGDVLGLTSLLAWLEESPPMLAVRALSVTQPEPAAPEGRPESLQITLVVEGLARGADAGQSDETNAARSSQADERARATRSSR